MLLSKRSPCLNLEESVQSYEFSVQTYKRRAIQLFLENMDSKSNLYEEPIRKVEDNKERLNELLAKRKNRQRQIKMDH